VAGQAQTGTGKTAAFLLAIYQALLTRPPAPGRLPSTYELARPNGTMYSEPGYSALLYVWR